MTRPTTLRQIVWALAPFALVLALLAGVVLTTAPADARPANEIHTWYFSDASHTELVGTKTITCYNGTFTEGIQTIYYEREVFPCDGMFP